MKTSIDSQAGVVTTLTGNGVVIEGKDYHEAPFDDRWDDLYAYIDQGTGPAALTYEAYRDTGFFMRFFRHNQDDNIFMTFQMPHSWDVTTSVKPHMHVIPMASGSGDVKMNFAYTWCLVHTGSLPAASGWTSGSVLTTYNPGDQFIQHIISFGDVPVVLGSHESAVLVFKIERPGSSDNADTYVTNKVGGTTSANLGVLFFDLHYKKIKAGSVSEFPEG